jgi:glycosyltransferase involved in cell wall biosynthesis
MRSVRLLVEHAPFDVVISYGSAMARYVFEPPIDRTPCVLDMIDIDSEKWMVLGQSGRPLLRPIYRREARLLRRFERRAFEHACATSVVNERELVVLDRVVGRPGGVAIPNGVDMDSFKPPEEPSSRSQVVFCGVFNYAPNEEGALWLANEVWPKVLHGKPDATLVLVGAEPTKAVADLARRPSITVTGTVPDVRPFLWDSAVSAAPLHLARGVQNKVLEALVAGLPCVVTPPVLEGLPEAVRPACRSAADAGTFAEHVVALLREPPVTRRSIANRADLSRLGWPERLQPFLQLVDTCARARRKP